MNRRMRLLTVIVLAALGIAVLAYPALSSYVNAIHSSRAVQSLRARLDAADSDLLRTQRQLAQEYNRALSAGELPAQYEHILDFGNGVMGYLEIPGIDAELSIYHGVSDVVLQKGVGHMPASALPIGGTGNHCVLTGHTGLPSAELFTHLTELKEGDLFYLHVLDEVLTYAVDRITVVLPHEVDALGPVRDKDYCTLVTCTPYGINSHRLLVRGERLSADAAAALQPGSAPAVHSIKIPVTLILAGGAMLLMLSSAMVVLLRRDTKQ